MQIVNQLSSIFANQVKDSYKSEKNIMSEEIYQNLSVVIKNISENINLADHVVVRSDTVAAGINYQTFVLIKYPVLQISNFYMDKVKNNAFFKKKMKSKNAIQELESKIENIQKRENRLFEREKKAFGKERK